jgi:hypothetical protein
VSTTGRASRARASTLFRNRTLALIWPAGHECQLDRSNRSGAAVHRCSSLHSLASSLAWRAERLQPAALPDREQRLQTRRRMSMWIRWSIRHPAHTVIRRMPLQHLHRQPKHRPRRPPGHGQQTTSCCEILASKLLVCSLNMCSVADRRAPLPRHPVMAACRNSLLTCWSKPVLLNDATEAVWNHKTWPLLSVASIVGKHLVFLPQCRRWACRSSRLPVLLCSAGSLQQSTPLLAPHFHISAGHSAASPLCT